MTGAARVAEGMIVQSWSVRFGYTSRKSWRAAVNLIPSTDAKAPDDHATIATPVIPAAPFGIVLGLGGMVNAWRAAEHLWHVSALAGHAIALFAIAIWILLLIGYAWKWIYLRQKALAEIEHPVQCCFVGLIGVSTMLVAALCLPYSGAVAHLLFWLGALWTVVFAVWRTGGLWTGGREPTATTAVLYLPTVAGSYVVAIAGASLGYSDIAQLAFGAGSFPGSRLNLCFSTACLRHPASRSRCARPSVFNLPLRRWAPLPISARLRACRTCWRTPCWVTRFCNCC